jgi:hypothetical protein
MVIGRRSLLLAGAAFPASAYGQCVTNAPAVDACRGGVRNAGPAGGTLDLNFMFPGSLDSRVTFTRASTATYTDSTGTIQTAATNAPRWDYASGVLRGLLIEEQRTNIWLQSADASQWGLGNGGGGTVPVVTANNTTAPNGTMTASRVVYPAVTAGQWSTLFQGPSVNAAQYSFSVWLRGNVGGERVYVGVIGNTTSSVAATLTTQWQRFTLVTATLAAGNGFFQIGTDLRDGTQAVTPAQTVYAWGADVQQGAFPTSHIPTTSVGVTRAQDSAVTTDTTWMSPTTGTWFAEFISTTLLGNNGRVIGEAQSAAHAGPIIFATGGNLSSWNGTTEIRSTNTISPNVITKGVLASSSAGTGKICLNAGPVTTGAQTQQNMPVVVFMQPVAGVSNENLSGYLRRVTYWNRVLSDAELQQVTT